MAIRKRKSRPRTVRPRARWSEEACVDILAWLEICKKRSKETQSGPTKSPETIYKETVVEHLARRFHCQPTLAQVEWKLENLWWRGGKDESKHYSELYLDGISGLNPEYELYSSIEKRVVELLLEEESEVAKSFLSPRLSRSQYRNSPGLRHVSLDISMEGTPSHMTSQESHLSSRSTTQDLDNSGTVRFEVRISG